MPTLRIMSIYRQQKEKFASELAEACGQRDRFQASLAAHFGAQLADAIRHHRWWNGRILLGEVSRPKLPEEGSLAVKQLRTLDRKVRAVWTKIRTPDCWFRELPGFGSVLGPIGMSWRNVHERCTDEGRLTIAGALWLLKVLNAAKRSDCEWTATDSNQQPLSPKWQQRLRRRRERLIHLLHTAVVLEEDVAWQYRL